MRVGAEIEFSMKTIVDQIVEQAEERLSWLRGEMEDRPHSADLAGRVMEAEYNLTVAQQAQDVVNAGLRDMRELFETHEHTAQCSHDVMNLNSEERV